MITKDRNKLISFWSPHIEKMQASGVSRSNYCRTNDLKDHQMAYWEKRLSPLKTKKAPINRMAASNAFVKAKIQDDGASKSAVPALLAINAAHPFRLIFGDDVSIELGAGADPIWVAHLIRAIRGA